jgi:hypothetical protein
LCASAAYAKDAPLMSPEPDSMGRVHFGPPGGEGLGRVTVKAPPKDEVKVFLDGRYFGKAPITIHSVPKGDYIVEGHYPDGRQVTRPVSVSENEEETVELTAGKIETPGAKQGSMFVGEISPERMLLTKGLIIGGAAALAFGITFGILDLKAESDYNNAKDQPSRDSITTSGKRDATLANVGFILAGACLIGAAFAGYPLLVKPTTEKPMALVVAPVAGGGVTGGAMMLRF